MTRDPAADRSSCPELEVYHCLDDILNQDDPVDALTVYGRFYVCLVGVFPVLQFGSRAL